MMRSMSSHAGRDVSRSVTRYTGAQTTPTTATSDEHRQAGGCQALGERIGQHEHRGARRDRRRRVEEQLAQRDADQPAEHEPIRADQRDHLEGRDGDADRVQAPLRRDQDHQAQRGDAIQVEVQQRARLARREHDGGRPVVDHPRHAGDREDLGRAPRPAPTARRRATAPPPARSRRTAPAGGRSRRVDPHHPRAQLAHVLERPRCASRQGRRPA